VHAITSAQLTLVAGGITELQGSKYALWWGIAGLILPVAFVTLLVALVRAGAIGRRARLPVSARGAVTVVGHLLRREQSLTPARFNAPSVHGQLSIGREQVRWIFDKRGGWQAPAGVLIVRRVHRGLDEPVAAGVDFEIGGTGEWAGAWRLVLGGPEPQDPSGDRKLRRRRRSDAALATQLAAALVSQGAIDARAKAR
jgi:hypothetical protein